MILDSNILIYAGRPNRDGAIARQFIAQQVRPGVSLITYVEVFGFRGMTDAERRTMERLFASLELLDVTFAIVDQAAALRRMRRMSVGDAVIAATALAHSRSLATRNVGDFAWITGLSVVDPYASP